MTSASDIALDRAGIVQLVLIPAFKPTLDHLLTEDMTLCPIRALRY